MKEALASLERMIEPQVDGLAAFDRELRFVHWSAALERLSGIPARELLGSPVPMVIPTLHESLLRETLTGRSQVSRDALVPLDDSPSRGETETFFAPVHGGNGEIVGGTIVVRDLRERGRIEQRLVETEQRFRTMADCSPVMLWMSETDSLCSFFNQTWLDFSGRSYEQERGVGWAEGVHAEDFQTCMDSYIDAFNARRAFEMEYRLRRHDGEYRWILDRGAPRYAPDGSFAGFIGSCIDITDRKRSEQELHSTAERLTRANGDLEQFVRITAHDLRGPLRAIDHLSQWIDEAARSGASDELLEHARRMRARVTRMDRLIDAIRRYASAGRNGREVERVDVAVLVRDVFELLDEPPSFELLIDAPIEPFESVLLPLQQVLQNLVWNAVRHHDRSAGRISVRVVDAGARLNFSVRDDGPGIPPELHERAQQMFQTLRPRKEDDDATGMGLALVKRLVEERGGELEMSSPIEAERGLEVRFSWPRSWSE